MPAIHEPPDVKENLRHLNGIFENRIRLALMSILSLNEAVEFNEMKRTLGLTDGNLSAHMKTLEKHRYVTVRKEFRGKKPFTRYAATREGKRAFILHLGALGRLIGSVHRHPLFTKP